MPNYNVKTAQEAVQFLVDTPYYSHHCRKIRSSVLKPRSLPFKDDLAPLNELIIIGRQDAVAMEALLELAKFKRDDYNEYQRKFMAQKRARDKRVIKIQETMLGKILPLDERKLALADQYVIWNKEKAEYVNNEIESFTKQFSKAPDGNDKYAFIREFWEWKDAELSMMEERADAVAQHVNKVVQKRQVKSVSQSVIEQKLMALVDKK